MRILKVLNTKNDDIFGAIKDKEKERNGGKREAKPYDDMSFPCSIPTKFFLSTVSHELGNGWYKEEHEKQLTPADGSEVRILSGDHFLHHNQAVAIARAITRIV